VAKENKLTPGSNLMWESSRMMLPEHKAGHVEHRHELNRRERIYLDEQVWSDISLAVAESMERRKPIRLTMYDPFEQAEVAGVIDHVDQPGGRFMVDGEWFKIGDIEGLL
jgi:hypothetical protein